MLDATGQTRSSDAALRRCVLVATVTYDLDVALDADGSGQGLLRIGTTAPVFVPLRGVLRALDGAAPSSAEGVDRLARWLVVRHLVHRIPLAALVECGRALGLPAGHLLHPGPSWIRARVPGRAIDLGLGLGAWTGDVPALLYGLGEHRLGGEPVLPIPPGVLEDAGIDPDVWWPPARERLEHLGRMAAERRQLRAADPGQRSASGRHEEALRPLAGADVISLLGTRSLRCALLPPPRPGSAGLGLVGVVVPTRDRGWVVHSAIDPTFGPATAAATAPAQRGFARPLLVTADEVVVVAPRPG